MRSVIILYGGDSVESQISLQSAEGIIKNIDQTKFSATMQDIKDFDVKSINKEALNYKNALFRFHYISFFLTHGSHYYCKILESAFTRFAT